MLKIPTKQLILSAPRTDSKGNVHIISIYKIEQGKHSTEDNLYS